MLCRLRRHLSLHLLLVDLRELGPQLLLGPLHGVVVLLHEPAPLLVVELGHPALLVLHLLQPSQHRRVLLPAALVRLRDLLFQPSLQGRGCGGVGGVGVLQLFLQFGFSCLPGGVIGPQLLGQFLPLGCLRVHGHAVLLVQFGLHLFVPLLQLHLLVLIPADRLTVLLLHVRQLPPQVLLLGYVAGSPRRVVAAALPVERRLLPLLQSGRRRWARVVRSLHGCILHLAGGLLHILRHPNLVRRVPDLHLPRLLQIPLRQHPPLLRLLLLQLILRLLLLLVQPAHVLLRLVVLLPLLPRLFQLVLR
mmetsp:Transcript_71663/g.191227  ORF Transcript_71663/g.191227 Transcript_71663/m.191227 type:complete len:305 (-) Transcript_71663:1087-2001(-)